METLFGLFIIAIGSFGQSSSYVPINKVKDWAWESFWLVQGIFAWIVFPYLGSLLAITPGHSLGEILGVDPSGAWKAIGFGALWGIGGLTFGLSMRYLGVALGQSLALGTCSAFGTLIPALLKGENLFIGSGLFLLIGVAITLAGIATIGFAGSLRAKNMSEEAKKAAIKDFALKKGLLIALLAGIMSACFSLGLDSGELIKTKTIELGAKALFALNPVIFLVTLGGFFTNLLYCGFQNIKNKTWNNYFSTPGKTLINNVLFCALAGVLWYSQFFGYGMGKSYFTEGTVMMAFSWSILMSLNVTFSNIWGIILKEWKGSGNKTIVFLIVGMLILIFSLVFPKLIQ